MTKAESKIPRKTKVKNEKYLEKLNGERLEKRRSQYVSTF
jgi:hypothetical protein